MQLYHTIQNGQSFGKAMNGNKSRKNKFVAASKKLDIKESTMYS